MNESAQIGFFPGLLDPATRAAEKLLANPELQECEVDGMPGFLVSRARAELSSRTLHAFEHNGQQFIIFQ